MALGGNTSPKRRQRPTAAELPEWTCEECGFLNEGQWGNCTGVVGKRLNGEPKRCGMRHPTRPRRPRTGGVR